MSSPVQIFIDEYQDLHKFLLENGQVSASISLNNHYRKIFLLSCASLYESRISKLILDFVSKFTSDDRVVSFLSNKAIKRQYHTYFSWEQSNANNFLGLFGKEFKDKVSLEISQSEELSVQVKAFLKLGNERNKMVHGNFLEYILDSTFEEIQVLHTNAIKFIEFLEEKLK